MEIIESFMNNHKRETSNVKYLIVIRIYIYRRIFHAQSVIDGRFPDKREIPPFLPWFSIPPTFSNFFQVSRRVKTVVDGHPSAFFIGTNRRRGEEWMLCEQRVAFYAALDLSEHRFPIIRSVLWWSGCKYVVVIKAVAVRNAWYERSIT